MNPSMPPPPPPQPPSGAPKPPVGAKPANARAAATFNSALERPTAEREAFIAGACGEDAEMQAEVRALNAIPLPRTLWAEWTLLAHPDDMGWGKVLLAQAQVAQGQAAEALKTLDPALALYRQMKAQGADHLFFRQHFVRALYVQALAQPADAAGIAHRRDSLAEAAKLLAELTDEARQLHDTRELLAWIEAEQKKPNKGADISAQ